MTRALIVYIVEYELFLLLNNILAGFRILNNTNNYSFNNINNITKRLHFNTTIILFILDIDFQQYQQYYSNCLYCWILIVYIVGYNCLYCWILIVYIVGY